MWIIINLLIFARKNNFCNQIFCKYSLKRWFRVYNLYDDNGNKTYNYQKDKITLLL